MATAELIGDLRRSETRARALEEALLDVFGWTEDTVPIRPLGNAYRRLSEDLINATESPGVGTGGLGSGQSGRSELVAAVWGFVYGMRSFHVASRILPAYARSPGRLVDLGGGWGPAALWGALNGFSVKVIESEKQRVALGKELFRRLGLHVDWEIRSVGPSDAAQADLAVWSFSLREMVGSVQQGAHHIGQAFQRMAEGGRILILESGAKPGSRFVMGVRDAVLEEGAPVLAPCQSELKCPARAAGDWCHFTWRLPLGPVGSRIASSAGRKGNELHVSWLMVGEGDKPTASRVLQVRRLGKVGAQVLICASDGLQRVVVHRKLKSLCSFLEKSGSGQLARLDGQTASRIVHAADWEFVAQV